MNTFKTFKKIFKKRTQLKSGQRIQGEVSPKIYKWQYAREKSPKPSVTKETQIPTMRLHFTSGDDEDQKDRGPQAPGRAWGGP